MRRDEAPPLWRASSLSPLYLRNSYTLKEGHIAHLMKMLTEAYGGYYKISEVERDKNMRIFMNWTMECIRHSDIITIFDIRR